MTREEAIAAIAAGAEPGSEAFEAYYGSSGFYSQSESVERAEAEAEARELIQDVGQNQPAPFLYAQEACGSTDYSCSARNAQRQQANMALTVNASRDWNEAVCNNDWALNAAATGNPNLPNSCALTFAPLTVPAAPPGSVLQQAVAANGQVYAPILGETLRVGAAPGAAPAATVVRATTSGGAGAGPQAGAGRAPALAQPQPNGGVVSAGAIQSLISGDVELFGFKVPVLALVAVGALVVFKGLK